MPKGPSKEAGDKVCANIMCDAWYPNHYWGKVRAHEAGWFDSIELKKSFCPQHNPPWVAKWRKKKEKNEQ